MEAIFKSCREGKDAMEVVEEAKVYKMLKNHRLINSSTGFGPLTKVLINFSLCEDFR